MFKYLKAKAYASEHGEIASVTQAGAEEIAKYLTKKGKEIAISTEYFGRGHD